MMFWQLQSVNALLCVIFYHFQIRVSNVLAGRGTPLILVHQVDARKMFTCAHLLCVRLIDPHSYMDQ